jgi:hypothetical protein
VETVAECENDTRTVYGSTAHRRPQWVITRQSRHLGTGVFIRKLKTPTHLTCAECEWACTCTVEVYYLTVGILGFLRKMVDHLVLVKNDSRKINECKIRTAQDRTSEHRTPPLESSNFLQASDSFSLEPSQLQRNQDNR